MNLNRFFKIRLTGPSGTPVYNIDGTTPGLGITAGSMHLEEILCDGELELGACNANKFEVEVYGLTHDVSGYAIEVYNDYDPNNPEYLFVGKIDSSETDKYNMYRDIVAYDAMYWARNEEVGEWWKDFWTDHEWTYLRDLRNSLCEFVGISVATGQICYNDTVIVYDADAGVPPATHVPLVTSSNDFFLTSSGDNFLVILPIDATTTAPLITQIKFGALLRMICELQACCPNINRLGQMEFVTIGVTGTSHNIDQAYDTNNAEFQDYTTDTPTGFNVYDTSEELAQRVPDTSANTNPYAISGNVFLLSATAEQISNILSPLIPAIRTIVYRPATIPMIVSDLSIRLGNAVSSTHRGVRSTHFVLAQELSGSSLVDQTITSPAYGKKLNDKASSINDIIAQGLKFSQIKQDIDGISLRVGEVVDASGNIRAAEIMLAINDDGSTIKISADHIDLTGYVTVSDLSGTGTTKINGSNITTGAITIKDNGNNVIFSADATNKSVTIGGNSVSIGGWTVQDDYMGVTGTPQSTFFLCESGKTAYVPSVSAYKNCVFYSGGNFAVDTSGALYASSAHITGEVTATSGTIGGCTIVNGVLQVSNANVDTISANKIIDGTCGAEVTFSKLSVTGGSIYYTDEVSRYVRISKDKIEFLQGNYGFMVVPTSNPSTLSITGFATSVSFSIGSNTGLEIHTVSGAARGDLTGSWYLNNSSILTSSDRNKKNTITYNYAEYDEFFDSLRPALFKYNDGTSGRLHTGFIAQDVEEALSKGGISTQNFAGLATCNDGGNVLYYLRYEEFISLNTWQIQQLKARVAELEKQIATLQNKKKEIN